MKIKIHRGTHQIGGCITEIKTAKARIIIDIGSELPTAEKKKDTGIAIEGVTTGKPDCDGIFVTHYHGDHIGMFEKVLPEVPIYMGEIAKQIFAVVQQAIKTKLKKGNPELIETFKTFTPGKKLKIKDITITPLMVDHSAFDAYALLIEAEGKRILHTGDFRMHGARGKKMPLVFAKYAGNLDVLITEGTMLGRPGEKVMTEHEMGKIAEKLMRENKNTLVLCSSTNIDSIAAFYNAAIANRKPFIVYDFQDDILKIMNATSKSSYYDFTRQTVYKYNPKNKKLHDYMNSRGFCMMIRANNRANSVPQQVMKAFPDNLLIYSLWAGYLEKHRPAYDEYKAEFIDNAIKTGSKFAELHTSGHATAEDIKKLCEITKPKIVIPIHVEEPQAFTRLGIKGNIKVLNDGEFFDC
ncbi:MAG: MBL fold metallo-hydrolase [Endomicrobia bacterium]|nr:MBL fold metallo-hydrolase [Endomicrobiia bacterium]MCL2506222.1 MBL fold metallo-hydrolase [Endomicrobiia bacterium]